MRVVVGKETRALGDTDAEDEVYEETSADGLLGGSEVRQLRFSDSEQVVKLSETASYERRRSLS